LIGFLPSIPRLAAEVGDVASHLRDFSIATASLLQCNIPPAIQSAKGVEVLPGGEQRKATSFAPILDFACSRKVA
jgi:hypothetical protein